MNPLEHDSPGAVVESPERFIIPRTSPPAHPAHEPEAPETLGLPSAPIVTETRTVTAWLGWAPTAFLTAPEFPVSWSLALAENTAVLMPGSHAEVLPGCTGGLSGRSGLSVLVPVLLPVSAGAGAVPPQSDSQ